MTKRMRIYLIIDETRFYHPGFVSDFLKKTTDEVVGGGLVTRVPSRSSIDHYLRTHWYYLKPSEMAKLAVRKYTMAIKDLVLKRDLNSPFYSVRSVFEFFKIDFMEVRYDINQQTYIDRIKEKEPDVIVSSNSLIFKGEVIGIPKICCLNRHSALLPSYGGLWPVFQAYRRGEEYTGVSVHVMERKIDTGHVLAQRKIRIEKKDTIADLYDKCFTISADVVIAALEKVRKGDFTLCSGGYESSYFSFPVREHWQEFRERGGRFI